MSRHGHRLSNPEPDGIMVCPESSYRYQLSPSASLSAHQPGEEGRGEVGSLLIFGFETATLCCLDLDEESPLARTLGKGSRSCDEFKHSA